MQEIEKTLSDTPPKKQKTKAKQQFPQQQVTPKTLQNKTSNNLESERTFPVVLHSKS